MTTTKVAPKLTDQQCEQLYREAHMAGMAAGELAAPTPMYVVGYDAEGNKEYFPPVMEGVCGFAWVNVSPGNSRFANWLKKRGYARRSYYGGVDIWVHQFNQSYERKMAYADAAAEVLKEAGIEAYGMGRLD